MTAPTLAHLLLRQASHAGIHFVSSSTEDSFCDYLELRRRALMLVRDLRSLDVEPRSEIIIAFEAPADFVTAFWACQLGGWIPVPVQPPHNQEQSLKLLRIFETLHHPYLLTDRADYSRFQPAAEVSQRLAARTILLNEVSSHIEADDSVAELPRPSDIALIQFSSGSTGDPKGCVLTHQRLVEHLRHFAASARMDFGDTFLSWFPLTHDMGLIGWHLLPLFCGANQCLMPTRSYVWRPSLWLAKASQYRASILSTNNFGLKHFCKLFKSDAAAAWDLSCVRLLFNGAEPISARVCGEFQELVRPCGLRANAMFPGYGLAEATLAVTFPNPGDPLQIRAVERKSLGMGEPVVDPLRPESAVILVGLGRPIEGTSVRIVDSTGQPVGENRVGEVEILSSSVTSGYYRNPSATAQLFSTDGWLRTGDLGFLDAAQLFLTGRSKELIIQGGHNYYPQDIERVAEEVDGIELGKVVACGISDHHRQKELLVLFVYHKGEPAAFVALASRLREHLISRAGWLVDFVVPVTAIPKTTSGKIQRYLLAQRFLDREFHAAVAGDDGGHTPRPAHDLVALLQSESRAVLGIDSVDIERSLFEQGLTSVRAVEFHSRVSRALGRSLPISLAFDYPTISQLANFLSNPAPRPSMPMRQGVREPVAIIGLGCRFPGGADTPEDYWRNLASGLDAVSSLPPSRGASEFRAGFLAQVDGFDNAFFGVSVREAESLDPQARLLLEVCWEALERAGQDVPGLAGSETGVFVGISNTDYSLAHFHSGDANRLDAYSYTGIAPAMSAGRISHLLGFQGPAMAVDTACSSSLVAVHLAVQSLLAGECDLALAAGVNLILSPQGHLNLTRMGALSPTGACRAFDDSADGYVRGEGCGAVVLKRLSDAQAAGDPILAVIRGTAVNHDGRSSGLTVPNGPAQSRVIRSALARAGVTPQEVAYVEAHGTGTPLGDPIEVLALASVFGDSGSLRIGSVKTNIGHLESAAGIAGLIKTVLALDQELIPQSLHLTEPNRRVPWERLGLRVVSSPTAWPRGAKPRLAGVSSFGFSGTNAHVVVEEGPARGPVLRSEGPPRSEGPWLVPLAARSPAALEAQAAQFRSYLERRPEVPLEYLGAAAVARRNHPYRAAVRLTERSQFAELPPITKVRNDVPLKLGFVFSGQGSQWEGMGRELAEAEPIFREALQLFPPDNRLGRTDVAQAAIFAVQVGLTRLLAHYGIEPDAVVGHSSGEVSAFWAAGQLSLEDAVQIITRRGQAMQSAAGLGQMVSVRLGVDDIQEYLSPGLDIAAVNGPQSTVVAGSHEAIRDFLGRLNGTPHVRLPVEFAFHSSQMDSAAIQLSGLGRVGTARIPVYSTVSGGRLERGEPGSDYWAANVRQSVQFAKAIQQMARDGCTHFLEVGPHAVLSASIAECLEDPDSVIATLHRQQDSRLAFLDALGALYCRGYDPDWTRLYPVRRTLTDLPTYPWQRRRLWMEGFEPWAERTQSSIVGMVYEVNWVRFAAPPEQPSVVAPADLAGAIGFVQSLVQQPDPPRLVIETRGAETDPQQASLFALGTVISNEYPELKCVSVDYRDGVGYVPRLVRANLTPARRLNISPDRTYLITGARGTLGQRFTGYLKDRGARHLLLAGRQNADVTDLESLRSLLASIPQSAPLGGIFHAAGILEDATLANLDAASLARVMAPKAQGAWNLHLLTEGRDLDFFIMVSSAAVVLGSPGQAAYVAANASMDALARMRNRAGNPSLSARLGLIAGTRMASRLSRDLATEGILPLSLEELDAAWEPLWNSGLPDATLMRFDPAKWVEHHPANRAFFSQLLPDEPFTSKMASFRTATEVHQEILRIVAAVTKAERQEIDPTRPLQELGVDSLMTLQIRDQIARSFERQLPITTFWTYPTVDALSRYLSEELGLTGEDVEAELQKVWERYL